MTEIELLTLITGQLDMIITFMKNAAAVAIIYVTVRILWIIFYKWMFKSAQEGGKNVIDLTGIDLSGILDEILALIPTVLPVLIGFVAFRKGFGFLLGVLRGA